MAFSSRSLVTEKPHFTVTFSWKWNLCWDLGLGTMLVTQKLQQSFRIGYESSSRTDGDCLRPRRVVLQKSYRSCRTAEPGRARNC